MWAGVYTAKSAVSIAKVSIVTTFQVWGGGACAAEAQSSMAGVPCTVYQ